LRAYGIGAPIISIELPRETEAAAAGSALRSACWREEFRVTIVWLSMTVSPKKFDADRYCWKHGAEIQIITLGVFPEASGRARGL
jgi:hypothetical protein